MVPGSAAAARLPTLDGWRTVAVLIVIWGHLMPGFYASEAECYARSLSRFGGFGVDIFFGISGFLITRLLLDEKQRSGRISIAAFYVRRAFRILPPCFLYLAAVAIAVGFGTRLELLSSVFFFRNYIPNDYGSHATAHLWSLAVEEHFYLLWPALLVFVVLRQKATSRATIVAWIAIACALWRIADAQTHLTESTLQGLPLHFRTDLRLDALLWGCFAAFLIDDPQKEARFRKAFPQWAFFGLLLAGILCIARYSLLTSLWLAMIIPLLLLGTVLHPEWIAGRLLEHSWIRFIGRISYSLYLWQQLFLLDGWEHRLPFQKFPQNLILTFACALVSYRFLEKPCMNLGRRLSARIQTRGANGQAFEPATALAGTSTSPSAASG